MSRRRNAAQSARGRRRSASRARPAAASGARRQPSHPSRSCRRLEETEGRGWANSCLGPSQHNLTPSGPDGLGSKPGGGSGAQKPASGACAAPSMNGVRSHPHADGGLSQPRPRNAGRGTNRRRREGAEAAPTPDAMLRTSAARPPTRHNCAKVMELDGVPGDNVMVLCTASMLSGGWRRNLTCAHVGRMTVSG